MRKMDSFNYLYFTFKYERMSCVTITTNGNLIILPSGILSAFSPATERIVRGDTNIICMKDEFHHSTNVLPTPRISVDDTDSSSSLTGPQSQRPYLKYHRRSNGPMISVDSEPR